MREPQNSRHVATAYLGRRFANLAIECSCLVNNQDARFRAFSLQYERRCRAGERAPDDHDVVIEIHRSKRMAFLQLQSKSLSDAGNRVYKPSNTRNDYFD